MGRVKDHYWEQICAMEGHNEPDSDDLEMLEIDAKQATDRYEAALKKLKENDHGSDKTTPAV
jgi:hypothetical protein